MKIPKQDLCERTILLGSAQLEHLRWYAEASGLSESEVIRRAVDALPWVTTRSLDPALPPSHWPMTGT